MKTTGDRPSDALQTRFTPPSNAFKPRFRRRFILAKMPSDDFRRTLHTLPLYTPGASEAPDATVCGTVAGRSDAHFFLRAQPNRAYTPDGIKSACGRANGQEKDPGSSEEAAVMAEPLLPS
jgi:hypothetical protein